MKAYLLKEIQDINFNTIAKNKTIVDIENINTHEVIYEEYDTSVWYLTFLLNGTEINITARNKKELATKNFFIENIDVLI